jgi:DNA-binding CsgD family transcriptional regulator
MTFNDSRNKERALGRIKRLASSGLPLEPFSRSVFELFNDAVPHSPNRAMNIIGVDGTHAFIGSTPELLAAIPPFQHYFVEKPENSGAKFAQDASTLSRVLPSKAVWMHDEIAQPDYLHAEGYNEAMRPLGWHRHLNVVFRDDRGYIGHCPVWRTKDQKPFSREDVAFFVAAAPHVSHGLKVGQLLGQADTTPESKSVAPQMGWGSGVILLDRCGKLIALDSVARLIFLQVGVFDGLAWDAFSGGPVRDSLDYIVRTLRSIFQEADGTALSASAPVSRIYLHWTGIVLRLRGIQVTGGDGREFITILIERSETVQARRQRFISRWGLSQREAEILELIAQNKTGPETAILLGVGHDTVRKHTSRVFEKLNVETRGAAAAIARDAALVPAF